MSCKSNKTLSNEAIAYLRLVLLKLREKMENLWQREELALLRFHYRFEIKTKTHDIESTGLVIKVVEKKEKPFRGA
jgi:hypothetical protein